MSARPGQQLTLLMRVAPGISFTSTDMFEMYDRNVFMRLVLTWPTDNSTTLPPPAAAPSGAASVAAGMVSRAAVYPIAECNGGLLVYVTLCLVSNCFRTTNISNSISFA
jgi:hypothetical protein